MMQFQQMENSSQPSSSRRRGRRCRNKAAAGAGAGEVSKGAEQFETEPAAAAKAAAKEQRMVISPDAEEVVAAMRSLYAEQLKPFGRILRKRVAELAVARGPSPNNSNTLPDVDARLLREVCETSPFISLEPEEGGDWCALLVGVQTSFVDVYALDDVYPPDLWEDIAKYFAGLEGEYVFLPGGRYSCAQALAKRQLPFLGKFSVGQICHIVQLSISSKKLLGYLNGAVVPYDLSQSMVKERCALHQQACAGPAQAALAMPVATWDSARDGLREILKADHNMVAAGAEIAPGVVPLSNVKRLFRSRFGLELSETALGHSKLSDLLQDARFHDICTVQLEENGYNVIERRGPCPAPTVSFEPSPFFPEGMPDEPITHDEPRRVEFCIDEPLRIEDAGVYVEVDGWPVTRPPTPSWPQRVWPMLPAVSPSTLLPGGAVGRIVQNTFIHTAVPPPTPMAGARRRSASTPKDLFSAKDDWETSCHALSFLQKPVKRGSDATTATGPTEASSSDDEDGDLGSVGVGCGSLRSGRSSSVASACAVKDDAAMADTTATVEEITRPSILSERRPIFCADEPLELEDAGLFLGADLAVWPAMSPGKLKRPAVSGPFVQNTFLTIGGPLPPTPTLGSTRRGQSLPRSIGARHEDAEAARVAALRWMPRPLDRSPLHDAQKNSAPLEPQRGPPVELQWGPPVELQWGPPAEVQGSSEHSHLASTSPAFVRRVSPAASPTFAASPLDVRSPGAFGFSVFDGCASPSPFGGSCPSKAPILKLVDLL